MSKPLSTEHPLIVYGASGVTGRLIVEAALRRGLRVIAAGRSATSLSDLAEVHGVTTAIAAVDDPDALSALCARGAVLLNAAGPFGTTAVPLAQACLAAQTAYVDVSGDVDAFIALKALDRSAKDAHVAIVAGAGYGVAVGECLGAHIAQRVPGATRVRLGLDTFVSQRSPGAAQSTIAALKQGGYVIRNGEVKRTKLGHPAWRIAVDGERYYFAGAPLAEAWAIWSSTHIPDVSAAIRSRPLAIPAMRLMGWAIRSLGIGSFLARRAVRPETREGANYGGRSIAVAEAWDSSGKLAASTISTTREGYRVAAEIAVAAAERIAGSQIVGFQTPASAFGPDFILEIDGFERRDCA